ncbi:MAG: TolC family protein [Planctomycetes bacterium]|nr:TolC family protein [Planctomycetota bacterium]
MPRLIEEVQTRNPSLQAMVAAWQAAAQRYPQAISLDDPMFMAMAAPASFDSPDVEAGYVLQGSQKFPWFGKRAARGRIARAETNAAYHDLEDSRLRLAEATQLAYFDYYLAHRQQELNRENLEVIRQFRKTAQSRYQANQVTQQDVLQAEVELAELERRMIELERMNRLAAARVNTLLRQQPFAPLPPPPAQLSSPSEEPDIETLQQLALSQRPDLAALGARVRAEQAAVTLACKEYYPDVEVFGRYDSFWQPADTQSDLRGQVGVNLNVPIYRGKLHASVREALSKLSQQRAEYEQRELDIRYEVAAAYEQVRESHRTLQLYAERLVPTAEQNVAAARSNYDVNKSSFLDLAIAQRQLIDLREKREEALATYHSRRAELMRAVGDSRANARSAEEVLMPAPQ